MSETRRHYVNGQWQPGHGGRSFKDYNPATGEVWAQVADADGKDAQAACEAAAAAFPAWAGLSHDARAGHLLRVAQLMAERSEAIRDTLVAEGGAWIGKATFEAGYMPGLFRAAAAAAYEASGEVLPSVHGKLSMSLRQPLGVVAVISPWNFPQILTGRGIAFALAAGNTVVVKPSEETPVAGGLLFAELFEAAGVPPGVLNVITCARDHVGKVGDALLEHPAVRAISFTGSTAVGRDLAARAGGLLKRACLELGGKDALIICDDADMKRAVEAATFGAFMHQGQICMSAERILVQHAIAAEFTERFVANVRRLKTGDPTQPGNCIGPIINRRQLDRIHAQVTGAVQAGADLLCGGQHHELFYEPTVLTQVTPQMSVFRDETFGPVAPIVTFADDEEAISLANDSDYGLSAGIITGDEARGMAIAERLHTGMAHINDSPVNDEPNVPFGGVKMSGLGRHGGRASIEAFTETRWITLERGGRHYPPPFTEA